MLSHARLKELLNYDPDTGGFTWRVSGANGNRVAGSVAGHGRKDGYWRIQIDHQEYYAHRLAWLYVTGRWPKNEIDHKNGRTSDNRIANLRESSNKENQANQRLSRKNKLGIKGVRFHKLTGKYMAQITVNGQQLYLGSFDDTLSASKAYRLAAVKHFGEFARFA